MINALRKNYGRTLWLTRLVLALTILFSNLFSINTFFGLLAMMGVVVGNTIAGYILYVALTLVITEFLSRMIIKFSFNMLRIFTIPYSEFVVLFLLALCASNLMAGAIKLVYFITPVAAVFGETLISFVTNAIAFFCLFLVTKKLYLNDKNAPYVFKWFAILFLGLSAVLAFFL